MNRIIQIKDLDQAKKELYKLGVSSQGIEVMAPKAINMIVKITDAKLGAANILKQEMLSIGGDAAVARGVVDGKALISDVILLANLDKIKKLIKKLKYQTIFGLPEICEDLERFVRMKTIPAIPVLNCRGVDIQLDKTRIMGILNVTPDSFSDGSQFMLKEAAFKRVIQMEVCGADIIDIGGESTRPGSAEVSLQEELDRVIPIIEKIRSEKNIPISIDTRKSAVACEALKKGANIINDISALRFDDGMVNVLQDFPNVPVILMHMQGTPDNMQKNPNYMNTVEEIIAFLQERIDFCQFNDISLDRIIVDPGIGFGKRLEDNLKILSNLDQFKSLNVPVLLGASRKSFINAIYKSEPSERLEGSLAATALAWEQKIEIVRVHDVRSHKCFLDVLNKTREVV